MHGVLGVDGGAAIEKQLDRVKLADARRGHESGFAVGIGAVRIDARVQQFADHGRVAVQCREGDGRDAVAVRRVHVGAGFDERGGGREVVVPDSPVQGRGAVGVG